MTNTYEKVKEWRKQNPDKVNEQARRYRAKHPETSRKAALKYREQHLDEVRERDREAQRAYRQTPRYKEAQARRNRAYHERQRQQQLALAGRPCPDVCEVCGLSDWRIVFDHCHQQGHFRGWICDRCNRVLGVVYDDPVLLRKLAAYLEGRDGETNGAHEEKDSHV